MKDENRNKRPGERGERVGEYVSIKLRGAIWYANFQINGEQQRESLETRSLKEARRLAARIDNQLLEKTYQRPIKPETIVAVVNTYKIYLETEDRAKKTRAKYIAVLKRFSDLAQAHGLHDVDQIDLKLMDEYRRQRKQAGRGAKTIYTESVIIKQLLKFAMSRGMATRNQLKEMKLMKPKPKPQPFWTPEQLQMILLTAKDDPYRGVFSLLAVTGMRISEAKYLTWDDVDLEHEMIHIRQKEIAPGEVWKPKSGDQRHVPIGAAGRAVLASLPRRGRWVFSAPKSATNPNGTMPIDERRVLARLKSILKGLELPGHLHTFRHSFISHALTKGVPEAVVRQWVGHVDAQVLKLYTHISDPTSKSAMEKLFDGIVKPNEDEEGGAPAA